MIKKYLPSTPIDDSLVSTREARSKLAEKIEAIKNPKPQAQVEPKVKAVALVDASQPQAPPAPAAAAPAPSPSPPASTVVESPAPPVERKAPVWPWAAGIVALAVIALLFWKRRA